jgi:Fe-S cluster assembly iron-binding protein IscA
MITVTPRARTELGEILASRPSPSAAIRVEAVRGPHGCVHGWRLGIEESERSADAVLHDADPRLVVDLEILPLLEGASLDYREDERAIGFVLDAPASGGGHGHGGCRH